MISARGNVTVHEKVALLNCRRLPGRLNMAETALLLGIHEHDVPVLISARLLSPLGRPASNAPKYFAAVEIADRASDLEWLSSATREIAKYWRRKNDRKRQPVRVCAIE